MSFKTFIPRHDFKYISTSFFAFDSYIVTRGGALSRNWINLNLAQKYDIFLAYRKFTTDFPFLLQGRSPCQLICIGKCEEKKGCGIAGNYGSISFNLLLPFYLLLIFLMLLRKIFSNILKNLKFLLIVLPLLFLPFCCSCRSHILSHKICKTKSFKIISEYEKGYKPENKKELTDIGLVLIDGYIKTMSIFLIHRDFIKFLSENITDLEKCKGKIRINIKYIPSSFLSEVFFRILKCIEIRGDLLQFIKRLIDVKPDLNSLEEMYSFFEDFCIDRQYYEFCEKCFNFNEFDNCYTLSLLVEKWNLGLEESPIFFLNDEIISKERFKIEVESICR